MMKTNFKISSRMHLLVIISSVIIAVGLCVGLICQFVANGFFNYSDDYANYKSITVIYEDTDFSGKEEEPVEIIRNICDEAFANAGVKSYATLSGDTETGGTVVYKFVYSTDRGALDKASLQINQKIEEYVGESYAALFNNASASTAETLLGGGKTVSMAACHNHSGLHCVPFRIFCNTLQIYYGIRRGFGGYSQFSSVFNDYSALPYSCRVFNRNICGNNRNSHCCGNLFPVRQNA